MMDTPERIEARLIRRLERLAREWPHGYFLVAGTGGLTLMRLREDGTEPWIDPDGNAKLDQDYEVPAAIHIPTHGGDPW